MIPTRYFFFFCENVALPHPTQKNVVSVKFDPITRVHFNMASSRDTSDGGRFAEISGSASLRAADDALLVSRKQAARVDSDRLRKVLSSLLSQSAAISSDGVCSAKTCENDIKEIEESRNRLKFRLDNLDAIAGRVRSDLEAHDLALLGLRIKRDQIQQGSLRVSHQALTREQPCVAGANGGRGRSRAVADGELLTLGGCALQ